MNDSEAEQNRDIQNRLHLAAQFGDIDLLRCQLSDTACEVDALDKDKLWTSLHFAANSGHHEVCQELLMHSADPNVRSGSLVKDGELRRDWYWEPGHTPLMLAALSGHFDVVQVLISMGADVNIKDATSGTALHAACCCNAPKIVEFLLSKGSKMDVDSTLRDFDEELGWHFMLTPLHVAANCGSVDAARQLLEHGAKINECWITKRNPLIYAAARGHADLILLLCKFGGNPNSRECRHEYGYFIDWTALHYAAKNGHAEAATVLLKCGAEPRVRESLRGQTALEVAEEAGHEEVVAIIRKKMPKRD